MREAVDYQGVGLVAGLEVHQQLLTDEKLFCRCPAGLYTESHDGEVLRHMRPTLSELGEYDGTALMEFKTKKEIVYLLNGKNVCTYEMDDTPPFLVNQRAIDIAIELSLLMHMDIIDEVHIARKQYLDGSIPTGFQRTAIVGVNGFIPFKGRKLTVTHLSVEEDSCREVANRGHRVTFRTDRLGTPLTETVTGPELVSPEEVRDAILLCGLVARSTGHARVGIGAARQDINVSVRGGNRVEIKGVARAAYAVKLVHNEAIRQVNLLRLRDKLHARGLKDPGAVETRVADVSDLFHDVELGFVRRAVDAGGKVMGVKVAGIADLAAHPTQPETTFLDELSGRIRVIACLDELPNVVDGARLPELPNAHLTRERLKKRLKIGDHDAFFLVWGKEADCRTAAEEIRLRFVDAVLGVPKETRKSLPGGHTTFERILPGPDRMYPDTDSPPTRVTAERVAKLRAGLPPPPWKRLEQYRAWGVPEETATYLIRRGGAAQLEHVVKVTGVDPKTAAVEMGQRTKWLARAGIPTDRLGADDWAQIFGLYTDGKLPREGIREVAGHMATEPGLSASGAMQALGYALAPEDVWRRELTRLTVPDVSAGDPADDRKRRLATGVAVRALKGKAAAKAVAAAVLGTAPEGPQ
ncbi:MAG: Glu-tRNA(Gln) amidotransferase subunit GatE [Deltaproteobacteria bacterium]|nr:Glu-tRNA(Gln) amidotransferase subunit GatE [Deltaproteobacteria bacterium]